MNESNAQKTMILSENLWTVMFRLSWPAVLAMILYGLNTVFDAIFVGRFVGETALAGVSLAYPLSQLTLGIGSLIGVGAGSALSIALGADDRRTQKKLMGNVNYLTLVITIVYTVAAWFAADLLVRFMGGRGEPLALGTGYFRITALGSLFWIYGLAANMVIRAEGRMKSAAVIMGIGLAVNILFNYILIVVLGMGVAGAAWGTNIGMTVYTLAGFIYFGRGKASFDARPFIFSRDRKIISSVISNGLPSLIMSVMSLVQAVVVFKALSRYGTTFDVALYGAVYRIFTLLLTPLFGLMRALQPVAGINYGAGRTERVIRSFKVFCLAGLILVLPVWLFMMISPRIVLGLMFTGGVLGADSLLYFRLFMALLPVLPVMFMAMTYFPAVDNGKPVAVLGMVRQLFLYVPVMLILPRLYGIEWVYYGTLMIDLLAVVWVALLVRQEFRALRKRTMIQPEPALQI